MDSVFERKLLTQIGNLFSSNEFMVMFDEIEGKNVLVIEPVSDEVYEDCNITVEDIGDESTAVNIIFTLFTDLPEDISDSADEILPFLNKYLSVGSFGLSKESGYFYFSCSYIADTDAAEEQALKVFLMTWQVASETALFGTEIIRSLVSGEKKASELMSEDISMVQFE